MRLSDCSPDELLGKVCTCVLSRHPDMYGDTCVVKEVIKPTFPNTTYSVVLLWITGAETTSHNYRWCTALKVER